MRIAVTSKAFSKNYELIQYLEGQFSDYKLNQATKKLNDEELIVFLDGCDAVILALEEINQRVLSALPRLKVISKFGVGLDNIDFDACSTRGVKVLYQAGVNKASVAELTLCFSISLIRNIAKSSSLMAKGIWIKDGGNSLFGKSIGIIGFGNIGTAYAELLRPFECRLLVNDIIDKTIECDRLGAEQTDLNYLIKNCDIISLHVPLTDKTRKMVDANFLMKMKNSAFILNTARGELIDYRALKNALIEGRLGGAALDVFEVEPPNDLDFLMQSNLIATPHIGGNSKESTFAMGKSAVDLLRNYLGGVEKI